MGTNGTRNIMTTMKMMNIGGRVDDTNYDDYGDENLMMDTSPQTFKSITAETLAKLIQDHINAGEDSESFYYVIDCRYPYEYAGGHIKGALNIYTEELIQNLLTNIVFKYKLLIFHCEFSSKRGPKIMRYLRKRDREINKTRYPHLYFPDVYLLIGGYKKFFSDHKGLCSPPAYVPMRHENFAQEYLHFRSTMKQKHHAIKKQEAEMNKCRKCLRF